MDNQNIEQDTSLETLETPGSIIQAPNNTAGQSSPAPQEPLATPPQTAPSPQKGPGVGMRFKSLFKHINIYLVIFVLLVLGTAAAAYFIVKKNDNKVELDTTTLDQSTLEQLKLKDVSVGDAKQTLSVESNAIFAGKVLIKGGLDVAGSITVGGALDLPGISVSGASNFDQVKANGLQISGNASVVGALTVQNGLNVTGNATFSGSITAGGLNIDQLAINGGLKFNGHIDAGGGTPGVSGGGALGGGGTASLSGTDTAGTVTLNTGGGPSAGVLANISFSAAYNSTPHVVITPVGSAGAGLNYYITRSTSGFVIASTNAPPGSSNFSFDYIVIE